MRKTVRIIAIATSVLYVVFIGVMISFVASKKLDIVAFLGFAFAIGINLILLWALDHALTRIERLENILSTKNIITDKDVDLEDLGYIEETPENLSECKNCGYQLFPEDKICPNCKTPREDLEDENKTKLTK